MAVTYLESHPDNFHSIKSPTPQDPTSEYFLAENYTQCQQFIGYYIFICILPTSITYEYLSNQYCIEINNNFFRILSIFKIKYKYL